MRKVIRKGGLSSGIKKLREDAGLTATDLAEKSSLSQAYISKLESGQNENLTLKTSKLLAEALGLSLRNFLEKIGYADERSSRPSWELVSQALRGNGCSVEMAKEIVNYARYKMESTQDSKHD